MTKDSKNFHVSRMALLAIAMMSTSMGTAMAFPSDTMNSQSTSTEASAQQERVTIKGVISDAMGPMAGVNVIEKGTTNGIITDLDGNFTLNVNPNSTLVISFIGYKTQEIKVGDQTNFTIQLKEDTQALEEVVVVGYGVQKKVNLTGAVASVDFEEQTKSRPITTVSSALAGLSPGLQASSGSAMPGQDNTTLRVRGTGTMNNSSPLVIIDGMEGSLNSLNPQDVENISVLKDAASCAIYGARAANGVILVTTKKGDREKVTINYSGRVSFNKPTRMIETMSNYADYMELMNESAENVGHAPIFSQENIDLWREKSKDPNGVNELGVPNYVAYPNTDWMKELYDGGMMHEHNLSVNGGSEKIRFMMSARYQDNEGVVENTGNKTYSLRANIEANPTKWLTVGTRTYASQMDREVGNFSDANNFLRQSTAGTYPIYKGSYGIPECSDESATANNPLWFLNKNDGSKRYNRFNTTLYSKINFLKDFHYDFNFNYNRYIYEARQWGRTITRSQHSLNKVVDKGALPSTLTTSFGYESHYSYTLENLLSWAHTFAQKHDVSALVGYQEYYKNYYTIDATKKGLIDETLHQFDQATDMLKTSGTTQDYATRSIFGRVNYAFNSRYLFEANFRYDGSSRFHKDHRWGFFPSVSAAWRISEESFMESTRGWLDNLKIRASWGKLGNSEIGNYDYMSLYSPTNVVFGQNLYSGLYINSIPNSLLKWEETATANFGVDANLLRNRLTFGMDVYYKKTDGILYRPTIPYIFGSMGAPLQNLAEVTNKGVELSLAWQDRIGEVSYSISGNFAYNNSEVSKYNGKYEIITNKDGSLSNNIGAVSSGGITPIVEGQMMNEFYLRNVYKGNGSYFQADGKVNPNGGPRDGMIRTENDMKWVKAMMDAGYEFRPGKTIAKNKIWYGDYIYADSNKNGKYGDDDDYTFQGKSNRPKYTFGFQISAAWKGFDISTVWAGAAGFSIYWGPTVGYNCSQTGHGNTLSKDVAKDHYFYNPEDPKDPRTNLGAKYPRMTYSTAWDQNRHSNTTLYLQNGNYLKLKNLSVGYTLPKNWVNKVSMQNARLYISAENLLTITAFDGQDPESGTGLGYAPFRTIAIGANISF